MLVLDISADCLKFVFVAQHVSARPSDNQPVCFLAWSTEKLHLRSDITQEGQQLASQSETATAEEGGVFTGETIGHNR